MLLEPRASGLNHRPLPLRGKASGKADHLFPLQTPALLRGWAPGTGTAAPSAPPDPERSWGDGPAGTSKSAVERAWW